METRRRCAATLLTVSSVAAFGVATPSAVVAAPGADRGQPDAIAAGPLDLGPPDLTESRTTRTPQPGVTLTEITRGASDPSLTWTLEVRIPATSTSPDPLAPPRVISDEASAQALADRLRAKGYEPRVEARGPAACRGCAGRYPGLSGPGRHLCHESGGRRCASRARRDGGVRKRRLHRLGR